MALLMGRAAQVKLIMHSPPCPCGTRAIAHRIAHGQMGFGGFDGLHPSYSP